MVELLTLQGKWQDLRAKTAHSSRHLPQGYARYDTLGQLFAPGLTPASNITPLGLRRTQEQRETEAATKEAPIPRGGDRSSLPWPTDYRKRIHAIGEIVKRWEDKMDFAKTWKPDGSSPGWVTLTEAGLRWFGLPYHELGWPDEDVEEMLNHSYHISMVRLTLARRQSPTIPEHRWIGERELQVRDMPIKLAGQTPPTRPDGILEVTKDGTIELATREIAPIRRGQQIAIEVELSRKSFERYELEVFPNHLQHFAAAWYFCAPDAYQAVVAARRDRLKTDEQRAHIVIRTLEYD